MDNEFQEKLKNVLSDPEALSKISAIASSLGMAGQSSEALSGAASNEVSEETAMTDIKAPQSGVELPTISNLSDPRLALLNSLKPLLREEKRDKIDALTRAITVASMMKMFRK